MNINLIEAILKYIQNLEDLDKRPANYKVMREEDVYFIFIFLNDKMFEVICPRATVTIYIKEYSLNKVDRKYLHGFYDYEVLDTEWNEEEEND